MPDAADYGADKITVLEGLDAVRRRPGMYIGGVGNSGLHHLVWEILDNAVDEAMNGHANHVGVTLSKDRRTVTVADNGRGIPVDEHKSSGKSALEVILTTLHAGGKFDAGSYKTSGGLHGVGASVVNALSAELTAVSIRDGGRWEQSFRRGVPTGPVTRTGAARNHGTAIRFRADAQIFPKTEFDPAEIAGRLETASYLHQGLTITWKDETGADSSARFHNPDGLRDYTRKLIDERRAPAVHEETFSLKAERADASARVEAALRWTEATNEHVRSYVNGIPTPAGGTHEIGLRAGIGKAVRNLVEVHKLLPRDLKLTADDIREGLCGVLSVFVPEPQFQGQTKEKLNNPELTQAVDAAVRQPLEQWLNQNIETGRLIVGRIILAARARAASRAAQEKISPKRGLNGKRVTLPGKLSDCTKPGAPGSEIFIVEGDSAGGSAKQGRNRTLQAILPLRGKVLNTESTATSKVLENKELKDLVTALGCGIGRTFDPEALRYDRVIILADADADGNHIATLLLTFFYRHLRGLLQSGRIHVAQPPLYRIDLGNEKHFVLTEEERDRILERERRGKRRKPQITRFKGLGEMMPKVLWETTLDPGRRALLRVQVTDPIDTDRVMNELMGKNPETRFRFIMGRAENADQLDV